MGAPMAFAALSAGLLARKGAARPAMRPHASGPFSAKAEDLGWDDMGFEPLRPSATDLHDNEHDAVAVPALELSPVRQQQAKLVVQFGCNSPPTGPDMLLTEVAAGPPLVARPGPARKARSAFTLRLDSARHFKLRLACAVSGRSAQMLVTDAVDQLLGSIPELDAMVGKAPGSLRTAKARTR